MIPPGTPDAVAREIDCLEAIGLVAGRVAHDINNPLAGIQNSFLLVKDAIPESHPHHRYVDAIEREIARIAVVTRRLVDSYPVHYDRTSRAPVASIAAEALRLAQGIPPGSRIQVVTDNQIDDTPIAEPALLRQILRQLLAAALRAPDPDAPVRFDIRRDGTSLLVEIRYRGEPPVSGFADPYPARLIAILGGQWQIDHPGDRLVVLTLRLPLPIEH